MFENGTSIFVLVTSPNLFSLKLSELESKLEFLENRSFLLFFHFRIQ